MNNIITFLTLNEAIENINTWIETGYNGYVININVDISEEEMVQNAIDNEKTFQLMYLKNNTTQIIWQ